MINEERMKFGEIKTEAFHGYNEFTQALSCIQKSIKEINSTLWNLFLFILGGENGQIIIKQCTRSNSSYSEA